MTMAAWKMFWTISRMENEWNASFSQSFGNVIDRLFIQSGVQKRNIEGFGFNQRKSVHGRSGKPHHTGACLQDCRLQYDGDEEFVLHDEDTTVVQQLSGHPPLPLIRRPVDHMPLAFAVQLDKSNGYAR